ncbi:MAG TPA: glycine--tRNA ligase subunit beta [Burkholderiales bacterium]|nr:glycine--tRNA ligase subunit beta [Burkholderiales bacterium]
MKASLLIEILTEELPPRSLAKLERAFAEALYEGLVLSRLLESPTYDSQKILATPRRLAVIISQVLDAASDRQIEVTGPSVKAPPDAVAGFAKKHGVDVKALEQRDTPKGKVFVANVTSKGATLDSVLGSIVNAAIKRLPAPKLMRWGAGEAQFVRPVHGLVMLHGRRVVPGKVLGLEAGNITRGHRFMGAGEIALRDAEEYEERLLKDGAVIADFAKRRDEIERQLLEAAKREGGSLGEHAELLDEVTALVELPSVYVGRFDPAYLEVPQECLILTMRQNQKYFPLFDPAGKLLPKFLIVSNMKLADPRPIVGGNERVVRPRLEDARFFYHQDRKVRLEARVPQLARVVYHNQLGSQLERVERIQLLAGSIARALKADAVLAERAAWLSKADLLTGMVSEFPELQGFMGRSYASHDGEPREVADAIEAHYRPRFAGDRLPESPIACAVALADKLDALTGLFSIGQAPTGERDPFGLRRAALGVIRILVERKLELSLFELVEREDVASFIFERARGYFQERGYSAVEVDSVLSLKPARLDLVPRQLEAVRAFSAMPEAESLAAANKRIGNILKQAETVPPGFDIALMVLPEEKALASTFKLLQPGVDGALRSLDYTAALKQLASLKAPVDAFFDKVMVMDKDPRVRANRIGFLGTLHGTMNRIADLSKLAK